jgi:hypothetical protein
MHGAELFTHLEENKPRWIDPRLRYAEAVDEETRDVVRDFLRSKKRDWIVRWETIPAARLCKIWLDFGRRGFVRDERGLEKIAAKMLRLIPRLDAINALSGHDSHDPLKQGGWELGKREAERLLRGLCLPCGAWLVSDYGLPYLKKIWPRIDLARSPELQLVAIDAALNVVHQRGDIAAFFIEGGSKTLDTIASQGGYQSPLREGGEWGHTRNQALASA